MEGWVGAMVAAIALVVLLGAFAVGWENGARQCVNHPGDSRCQAYKGKE